MRPAVVATYQTGRNGPNAASHARAPPCARCSSSRSATAKRGAAGRQIPIPLKAVEQPTVGDTFQSNVLCVPSYARRRSVAHVHLGTPRGVDRLLFLIGALQLANQKILSNERAACRHPTRFRWKGWERQDSSAAPHVLVVIIPKPVPWIRCRHLADDAHRPDESWSSRYPAKNGSIETHALHPKRYWRRCCRRSGPLHDAVDLHAGPDARPAGDPDRAIAGALVETVCPSRTMTPGGRRQVQIVAPEQRDIGCHSRR